MVEFHCVDDGHAMALAIVNDVMKSGYGIDVEMAMLSKKEIR